MPQRMKKSVITKKKKRNRQVKIISEELDGNMVEIDPFALNYIKNIKDITKLLKKSLN